MLYFGGLTFCATNPKLYLKIPNAVAAQRIAEAVLQKYKIHLSLSSALENLQINGNIYSLLRCYRKLMVQRDVGYNDFNKSEEIHRDSFYFSLLQNHYIHPYPEFKVKKVIPILHMVLANI